MTASPPTGAALSGPVRWTLRLLPVAAATITAVTTRSVLAAGVALVAGWVVAVAAAALLVATRWGRRSQAQPRSDGVDRTTSRPVELHRFPAAPRIDLDALAAAERSARGEGGFLSGWYAYVGGRLREIAFPRTALTGNRVSLVLDPDEVEDGDRCAWSDVWVRDVDASDIDAVFSYEAFALHRTGATLELTGYRDGLYRATWYLGWNDVLRNAPESIPEGFLWEKNDDYYYGFVDPSDLDDVRDYRTDRNDPPVSEEQPALRLRD